MKCRCTNPNNKKYLNYGGRGIMVCKRWMKFENFLADMGERPGAQYSLDRIDNNAGYGPTNCRWATALTQTLNRRVQKNAIFVGGLRLADWAKQQGITYGCAHQRVVAKRK